MQTRCKFMCNSVTKGTGSRLRRDAEGNAVKDKEHPHGIYDPCFQYTIKMSPVYGNGDPKHENTKFWDASPGGTFELNCVNEAAVAMFEPGKTYYLDISPAPQA